MANINNKNLLRIKDKSILSHLHQHAIIVTTYTDKRYFYKEDQIYNAIE